MDVKYPQTALMEGTLRTFNPEVRTFLMQRIGEVAEGIAKTFRAKEANKRGTFYKAVPLLNPPPRLKDMRVHNSRSKPADIKL